MDLDSLSWNASMKSSKMDLKPFLLSNTAFSFLSSDLKVAQTRKDVEVPRIVYRKEQVAVPRAVAYEENRVVLRAVACEEHSAVKPENAVFSEVTVVVV